MQKSILRWEMEAGIWKQAFQQVLQYQLYHKMLSNT